jgi:hypothetical protein
MAPRTFGVVAALIALALAGPAVAKKKKKHHHKTPAGKTEPKETEESDTDESSSESKGAEGKGAREKEDEEKAPAKPDTSTTEEKPAAPEPEAVPVKRKRPVMAEAAPAETGEFVNPALELLVGGGAMFRNLTWADDVAHVLSPYQLAPGPELRTALEVYPAAFATGGVAANIGVIGAFNYGFATTSKSGTMKFTTKFQDFMAGLKFRIPLGTFVPYISAAYGAQSFRLDGSTTVPGVDYTFIRGGLGTRIWLTRQLDLDVGGAFLYVTDVGKGATDVGTAFPKATAYAADGSLSIGFRAISVLAVRAGVDFRQYGLSMNTTAADAVRVGGATDRYIVGWGGLEVMLDGLAGGGSGAAEEAKPAPADTTAKPKKRRQPEPDLSDDAGGAE